MLDLSKLSALELPKNEIEVDVLGVKQKITVTAYDDGVSLDIADIADTHPESQERRVRKMLLCECAKLSENEAEKLIRYDREACYAIITEIFNLRQKFVDAQKAEREKAKKNSVAETKMDTQV